MDLSTVQKVALAGFALGAMFGAIGAKTNFCTMGAVSDWVNMGDKGRLRAWLLAMGVAILGTQALVISGRVDLAGSISLQPNFSWLACLVGGLLFGIGMTLASGCGQRSLVRMGTGNLKSLVVVLVMGFTAFTTFKGLLAFLPRDLLWPVQIGLAGHGIADQSLAAMLGGGAGVRTMLTLLIGLGLSWYAFKEAEFRGNRDNVLAGVAIGLIVAAGWAATAILGRDEFDPVPVESMTFVMPAGNAVNYLMTWTGASINFGIATVLGMIAGAFVYSLASRTFRFEAFRSCEDMARHLIGAVLMGVGGILGFGCTIGQGVSGVSTLSAGAFLTVAAIVFGSALTMKVEYHRMDGLGWGSALRRALVEFRLIPAARRMAD
jgi:uncharacterized membrane protein YedE/YeeE